MSETIHPMQRLADKALAGADEFHAWAEGLPTEGDGGIFNGEHPYNTARMVYVWSYWCVHGGWPAPVPEDFERVELFLIENGCPVLLKGIILFGLKEVSYGN